MRFSVHHFTQYEYSLPVRLGEHTLRLLPQASNLSVLAHDVHIDPPPLTRTATTDVHGNRVLCVTFDVPTTRFRIDSRFEVVSAAISPPNHSQLLPLPWWGADTSNIHPEVVSFAQQLAAEVGYGALAFVDALCAVLYQKMDRQVRLEGDAQSAHHTLATLRGACRDITVLFMDCCRSLGIVVQFVSGYQSAAQTPDGQRYLHAWPEVFLPGLGFFGYDPTHGIPVNDAHIRLCAAPAQAATMPVEGGFSFVGASVSSTLSFGITVSTG